MESIEIKLSPDDFNKLISLLKASNVILESLIVAKPKASAILTVTKSDGTSKEYS